MKQQSLQRIKRFQHQKLPRFLIGAGLIEVAISILVISIGAVGMAGLQVSAKRTAHESVQRTTAMYMAMDMLERMRANAGGLAGYSGATVGGGTLATPASTCQGVACTTGEMATYDLWAWEQVIDGATEARGAVSTGGLINPTGCITYTAGTATTGARVTVAIAWEGHRALSNPTSSSCGEGLGKYTDATLGADAKRQVLQMSTVI